MEFGVHIIPIGEFPEPCLPGLHNGMPCQKVVFLNGFNGNDCNEANSVYSECEKQVRQAISGIIKDIETIEIEIHNYQSIIQTMLELDNRLKKEGHNPKYYINITSGTNIVAAALTTVAHFINAELYYILDTRKKKYENGEEVVRFPVLQIPDLSDLEKLHKDTFLTICDQSISNTELSHKMNCSKSKLRYYTRSLESWGLIQSVIDGKEKYWHITDMGKLAKMWIGEPLVKKKRITGKMPVSGFT